MNNVLEIDRVRHSYANIIILSDVYLKCTTNEIVGLLGRNGSGKSTLLKIIFGTIFPDNQNIIINDESIKRPYLKSKTISYLPQGGLFPPKIKVRNLIDLYVENKIKKAELLEENKIKNILNYRIRELSGGTLKYLEILVLLSQPTKFVLLDEPFSGISPIDTDLIGSILQKYKKEKGIIITDHNYEKVLSQSDRLYLLYNGICKEINNRDELKFYNYLP